MIGSKIKNNLKYSIVIPSYNEEQDIDKTLIHLMNLDYDNYDVIIVDDSNDNTPNIIKKYTGDKVKLIIPEKRSGRSEARNIGIKASVCDVVIILNADVHLPVDFLNKINVHYKNGYDAVSVYSKVKNLDSNFARYIELDFLNDIYQGFYQKQKEELIFFWTEGFSVKKDLLMKTSLFPSNNLVPIVAGEDVRLIDELRKYNCKGIYDETIVIEHISPSTFKEFWHIRKGRGEGTPQVRRFIDKWSFKKIFIRASLKLTKRLLIIMFIFPLIMQGYKLAKHSKKNKIIETFVMAYTYGIEQIAMTYGEFKSFLNLYYKTIDLK